MQACNGRDKREPKPRAKARAGRIKPAKAPQRFSMGIWGNAWPMILNTQPTARVSCAGGQT
jgi:hypothetical protein